MLPVYTLQELGNFFSNRTITSGETSLREWRGVERPIIPRSHHVVQYPCHRLQHHHVCACVYYIHVCQYECVHAVRCLVLCCIVHLESCLLSCPGSSVGRALCLESRVSWVRVPPRAAPFSFEKEVVLVGVALLCTCLAPLDSCSVSCPSTFTDRACPYLKMFQ